MKSQVLLILGGFGGSYGPDPPPTSIAKSAIEEYARAKNEMPDNIRVRILRNILNLSQQEIADSIGITQSRVSSLENNSINSQYYSAIFDKYEIVWPKRNPEEQSH